VVWRALRRDPAERYASMADLRQDLTHLDEVSIPEYLFEPSGARPRVSREHLVNAAVIAGILVLLAVVGVIAQLAHSAQVSP
jgi:ferric-dicitrate binding protein FerR (iron transport regulator)